MQLCDFDWRNHPAGFQAVGLFENGFGCSVIPEPDGVHYEVAVLRHKNGRHSYVCYDSDLTDDVFRYQTVDNVHSIIARARNLKAGSKIEQPHPFVTVF
jgi:hypothetical protein